MNMSRRDFVKATTGIVAFIANPVGIVLSQDAPKYRRVNVSDPKLGSRAIASYKKAIRKMLALPPEDPRNWYRHALIHTLDCPHANWWFLVWHRGYLGWFEQICRELSGDADFALPYWDWTAEPRIPEVMFEDELDPSHSAFIPKAADFHSRFKKAVDSAGYWTREDNPDGSFNDRSQYGQLLTRMIRFSDDLWFDILENPLGNFFFDSPNARGLSKTNREFDKTTTSAVGQTTLYPALWARDFISFSSNKTSNHSLASGSGILEGQAHNRVHQCVGSRLCNLKTPSGFMWDLMSPTDPIFYLHHANLDRLWDVWTRKQNAYGLPILPEGYLIKTGLPDDKKSPEERNSDYYKWAREPFLFFINIKGQSVTKLRADDYQDMTTFDYDYQPGSGEDVVPSVAAKKLERVSMQFFSAKISDRTMSATAAAESTFQLPQEILDAVTAGTNAVLVAKITLSQLPIMHGSYDVFVSGTANLTELDAESPFYAGTLWMFGHHVICGPFTFTVPISAPVAHLLSNKLLNENPTLYIRVVPSESDKSMTSMKIYEGPEIVSIMLEVY